MKFFNDREINSLTRNSTQKKKKILMRNKHKQNTQTKYKKAPEQTKHLIIKPSETTQRITQKQKKSIHHECINRTIFGFQY